MEAYAVCSHIEGSLTLNIFISQPSKLCVGPLTNKTVPTSSADSRDTVTDSKRISRR